ncbi:MAG: protein kinase, partial [bacterium]|nr:protein kinase [bacterium]
LHERGVWHRDQKPSNILVDAEERRGESMKLVDFGIATLPDDKGASGDAASSIGTWPYRAPEVVCGVAPLELQDEWACGVMLAELLRGERLWVKREVATANTREATLMHIGHLITEAGIAAWGSEPAFHELLSHKSEQGAQAAPSPIRTALWR